MMKKVLTVFMLCAMFMLTFAPVSNAAAKNSVPPTSARWLYPKQIKTYIPPNHKRTTMMKHAFAEWTQKTKGKVVFRYVSSPKTAQIRVFFVASVPDAEREIGLTKSRTIGKGKMLRSEIYIAEKTAQGYSLGRDAVYTCMLHEIGHAIGIFEHSDDPLSIMYPIEDDRQEILNSDLKKLYQIYEWK